MLMALLLLIMPAAGATNELHIVKYASDGETILNETTKETIKKTRVQTYYFDHEKKEIKLIEEKTKKMLIDREGVRITA